MGIPGWNIPDLASPFDDDARGLLSRALDQLEPPASRAELADVLRPEAAELLDALAVRCARGRGGYDLLIGAQLARLKRHAGENRLGFSVAVDFARERLGLSDSFTLRLIRVEEALRSRPLLRAAIWKGEVTRRKAEIVMRRARGEEEERWVGLARTCTVRELEELVKDPAATPEPDEDEPLRRIVVQLDAESGALLKDGLELAGFIAGPTTSTVRRLEVMAMEFLADHAGHAPDPASPASAGPRPDPARREGTDTVTGFQRPSSSILGDSYPRRPDVRELLERESRRWRYLPDPPPVPVGDAHDPESQGGDEPFDPYACQARLKELVAERNAWDHDLGRACLLIVSIGAWRTAQFASFEHYCHERLGMGASTVKQRIALERRLAELPQLREAMRNGRLSYEQARLVSRVATPSDVEARIEEAAGKTCIALRRSLDPAFQDPDEDQPSAEDPAREPTAPEGEGQMWNGASENPEPRAQAPGAPTPATTGQMWNRLDVVAPQEVATLVGDAVVAARGMAKQWLTTGQALALVAAHFVATHHEDARRKLAKASKVKKRDRFLCQIPGCSRAADHDHHNRFRSQGGSDELWNQIAVCAIHHLRCIHQGYLLVLGEAPDRLTFVLGEREVAAFKARM